VADPRTRALEIQIAEVDRILDEVRAGRPASAPEGDVVGRLAAALRGEGLPVDGRFVIRNTVEGVMLTVFPASGGGRPVEEDAVREALRAEGYAFDPGVVAAAVVAASGEPVVVGAPRHDYRRDGKARILLSDDRVRAYLVLVAPEPGGLPPSWEEVEKAARAADLGDWARAAARTALEAGTYGAEVLVAAGRPPVHGRDGRVEVLFDPDPHLAPPVDERDRADYRVVRRFANVRAGEAVARVHPPTRGEDGATAAGRPIPARDGAPEAPVLGRNVRLADDGAEVLATVDGEASIDRGRISVEPVLTIEGDLGMETGNVEHLGTVTVRGRIGDGFRVRASRDVRAASIGRADVEAGGSVVVEGGIIGGARVIAALDVTAKFVEGATVRAARHVVVREAILHGTVSAGRAVVVHGKGAIIGGRVVAGEEVWCRTLGADAGAPTTVEAGAESAVLDRLRSVETAVARDAALLDEARRAASILRAAGGDPKRLLALEGAIAALAPRLDALREEALRLAEIVRAGRAARVTAHEAALPRVRLSIAGATLTTATRTPFVTFRLGAERDEIATLPCEGPPLDPALARLIPPERSRSRPR
jgi:uncharacterized protein (DUF342 family)